MPVKTLSKLSSTFYQTLKPKQKTWNLCIKVLYYTHAILYKHCATISQKFRYSGKLDLNRFGKIVNMLLNCEPKTLATLLGLNSNFYF